MLIFKPYIVEPSEKDCEQIIDNVNNSCFIYSTKQIPLANELFYYEKLLELVNESKTLTAVYMKDLLEENINTGKSLIAFRHDIDADLITALMMSKLAKKHSVPISFYLLHTSSLYYGYFCNDIFFRHNCNINLYQTLQDNGAEIGLHIDPFLIYQNYFVDGSQAIIKESNGFVVII